MELMGKTPDMDSTPDTRLLRMDSRLLSMISTLQKLALEKHSQEAQVRMVDIDAQISELTIKGVIDTLSSDEHTVLLNLTASKQRIISELHTLSTSDLTEVVTKDEQVEFLCSHATLILAILTEVTSRPIKPRSTFETGTDKGLS